jgi:flavin-dependent dehydrogenase
VDYTGPIVPYYNFINLSPGGHMVYSIKNELWGFYYNREIFLRNLLTLVEQTKTKLMTSSAVTSVEDTGSGVKVKVKTQSGEQTFSAEKVIAADGVNSTVVDSLGLNQRRQTLRAAKAVGWVMEGFKAEAGVPDYCSWMSFNIPSVTPGGIMVGLYGDWNNVDLRHIMSPSEDAIRGLIKHPRYAPWFKNARVVGKTAWSAYQRLPTIKQPVAGNVLIVSDAISQESWIQGAVACGFKAAKATLKELEGKNGWKSYAAWLHKAFAFFACPEHFRLKAMHHVLRGVYNDEEIDFIYKQLSKEVGHPPFRVAENPGAIRGLNPLLYDKIVKRKSEVDEMAKRGWFN